MRDARGGSSRECGARGGVALAGLGLALLVAFVLPDPSLARTTTTDLISVSTAGAQSNGLSRAPSISAHGRYVAFGSGASNLVGGDTNSTADVFVRDRKKGETTRVNVSSAGAQANGVSFGPSISAGGRYVAFVSAASNLVGGDTNGEGDIFVRDRKKGETTRVSVSSAGAQGDGFSHLPSISADGRYVAFESIASNLVEDDPGVGLFVHDRKTGETTRVVSAAGSNSSISAHGRFVTFDSFASSLVGGDTNGTLDVFVTDRKTNETSRASVSSKGAEGNAASSAVSISSDGRFVGFHSLASNLVGGDTNGEFDVFVSDRRTGETTRLSVSSAGAEGDGSSFGPSISVHGRFAAFTSEASNLVAGDSNRTRDVFVRDRKTGETKRVSVSSAGAEGNAFGFSEAPSISAEGRYVAFVSAASNLVADDTNDSQDVFIRGPLR